MPPTGAADPRLHDERVFAACRAGGVTTRTRWQSRGSRCAEEAYVESAPFRREARDRRQSLSSRLTSMPSGRPWTNRNEGLDLPRVVVAGDDLGRGHPVRGDARNVAPQTDQPPGPYQGGRPGFVCPVCKRRIGSDSAWPTPIKRVRQPIWRFTCALLSAAGINHHVAGGDPRASYRPRPVPETQSKTVFGIR